MADCSDIIELALVLGLLRSAQDREISDKVTLYREKAKGYYKAIIADCGKPKLPDYLENQEITDEDIVNDFGDAVRPWLSALSDQCGCKCGSGGKLNFLEEEYARAIGDFTLMNEAEKIIKAAGKKNYGE